MQATAVLRDEHRVIERVIGCLDRSVKRAEARRPLQVGFFLDAAEFANCFADGHHHKKEERLLFPALVAYDPRAYSSLISAMLADHEQGRAYTRCMRDAVARFQAGDDSARLDVLSHARSYIDLLRAHINTEEHIVFKISDRVLPLAQQEQMARGFARIEHEEITAGLCETFRALTAKLDREASH